MKFAIDIGYGDTKVAYLKPETNEIVKFKFPTLVEKVKKTSFNFMENDEEVIKFNDAEYRVGNDVIKEPYSTRDVEFLLKFSPLIIYKAMQIIANNEKKPIENTNEIYTGLSIFNWNYNDEFAKTISSFNINNQLFKNDIVLYAQGQGIYIDEAPQEEEFVIVFDGGYNTNDVITFKNSKPIKEFSYASQNGIFKMIEDLQQRIFEYTGATLDEFKVQKAFIKKAIKFRGKIIDLTKDIANIKKDYFEKILWELKIKLKEIIDEADLVIISGGGAYYLEDVNLPENFKFGTKPYEYQNVVGYLKGELK